MFSTYLELGKLAVLRDGGQFSLVRNPRSLLVTSNGTEELQYVRPSYSMSRSHASQRLVDLKRQLPHLTFTVEPYGADGTDCVIWAQSPKKLGFRGLGTFKYFPQQSWNQKLSATRLLEWRIGMPYAQASYEPGKEIGQNEYDGGVVVFDGHSASSDEVVRGAEIYSLDTEAIDWWKKLEIGELSVPDQILTAHLKNIGLDTSGTRRDQLDRLAQHLTETKRERTYSLIGASNRSGAHYIGPFGNGNVRQGTVLGPLDLKLVDADSDEIVDLENGMMPHNALFVVGSNLQYDMLKRLGGTGEYKPGVDGSVPRTNREVGFYRRMDVVGRDTVDTAALAQHAMPQTVNNKLPTVLSHALRKIIEKPSDYNDQIIDQIEWAMGWEPARERQLRYDALDGIGPMVFLEQYMESLVLIAEMLGLSVTDLCTIAKNEAGRYAHDKRYFQRFNTVRKRASDEDISLQRLALQHLNRGTEEDDQLIDSRIGVYQNVHLVHLMPYLRACEPIIRKDSEASRVFSRMRAVTNPVEKLMLALYLEAFVSDPVQELDINGISGRYYPPELPSPKVMKEFEGKYGIPMKRLQRRAALAMFGGTHYYETSGGRTEQQVTGLERVLRDLDVINYSDYFVMVTHPDGSKLEELVGQMVGDGLALDAGRGTGLSAEARRFAFEIDGQIGKQGMDVNIRGGYKTIWERDILPEFVRLGIRGKTEEAREFLEDACELMRYTPPEKFEFVTTARRDADDYSIRAQVQRRVKFIGQMNAQRDQEVRERIRDMDDLYSRFGKPGKSGRLFDGVIGKFARAIIPGLTHEEFELIVTGNRQLISV